eukprot:g54036.t1
MQNIDIRKFSRNMDLMGTLFPSILLWLVAAVRGQWLLTPTQDTYVNSKLPLINYGAGSDLRLELGRNNILFEFDLASLPAARALKCNLRMVLYQLTSSFAEGTWDALGICVNNCTNPCPDGATWLYRGLTSAVHGQCLMILTHICLHVRVEG